MTVIADAVSPVEAAREGWRGVAATAGVPLCVIETVCPNEAEHHRRVTTRANDLIGLVLPTWSEVESRRATYEQRTDERLVLDTRGHRQDCVDEALGYLEESLRHAT